MNQAVILAGGKGTRLKAKLGDLPKPMIPIGGIPLLEHQVRLAVHHGCRRILLLVGYRAEVIQEYFGNGGKWGATIEYQVEGEPLGTAGAVLAAYDRLDARFVVFYGDEMVNVDLRRLERAHEASKASATLLLHPNDHPLDSDLVEVDADGMVRAFHNRPHPAGARFRNLVNAALYIVEKEALASWVGRPGALDFGKDVFPEMLAGGARLLGYNSPEYIKDIGTPERYERVCGQYEAGVVRRSSLEEPQVAVFLDRDGTLNREVDGVLKPDALELLPGAGEAVRLLNHNGIRAVVITNQPFVAKGFCSEADVEEVHQQMEILLGGEHAFLDRIFWCPHHPERGFEGERADLKVPCQCRKPGIGMVERARQELNLDLSRCWLVGDTTTDLETARKAGLRSILVRSGYGGSDGKYSSASWAVAGDILEAVRLIIAEMGGAS